MHKLLFIAALVLGLVTSSFCQIEAEKQLLEKLANAKTEADEIKALGDLADFYTIYRADTKSDAMLQRQLFAAELLNDKKLIVETLFSNSINNISSTSSNETYNKALAFTERGLDYGRETDNEELIIAAHLKKAMLFRKKGLPDDAFQQINLAFAEARSVKNDSLKAEVYLESGDLFFAKRDYVNAYKNYNLAYDIAYAIKNVALQSACYHRFANIYRALESVKQAKEMLLESIHLNRTKHHPKGLMNDFFDLFRIEEAPEYLDKAVRLADSLQSAKDQLFGKRLRFISYYKIEKSSTKALAYLQQNPDLQYYFTNQGLMNYNIGTAFQYSGSFDSAITYYKKAEEIILANLSKAYQTGFYKEMAENYKALGKHNEAITYFEKAFALSTTTGDVFTNDTICQSLSDLYSSAPNLNYEKAFYYANLKNGYTKQIKELNKKADFTLLEIDREKKSHDLDMAEALTSEQKRREAQYLGISLAIVFVFGLLFALGTFPVSKTSIRMLNFMAFICLFEFIILLIDNWLIEITHHEPLQLWLAKIVIIALLTPFHHFLEHWAVRFLSSTKLQRLRQKLSLKKLRSASKKSIAPPACVEHSITP